MEKKTPLLEMRFRLSSRRFQVSVEEWASMWDDYSKNPDKALEWQNNYRRFMFDLEDASGDGSIDITEFTSVCSCYGLKADECKEAFQKMSGVSYFILSVKTKLIVV